MMMPCHSQPVAMCCLCWIVKPESAKTRKLQGGRLGIKHQLACVSICNRIQNHSFMVNQKLGNVGSLL
jgi:hypothetical protein